MLYYPKFIVKKLINSLQFRPFPFLSSPHLQTILGSLCWARIAPPSSQHFVLLDDGDQLCCEVSTPTLWKPDQKTIIMIHGLGGSHASTYMVRIARKLYGAGYRIVRANLRGCGSGKGLAQLPYHGGLGHDILKIIQALNRETPESSIILLGFSLGGSIALNLAAFWGKECGDSLERIIAICPSIDLAQSANLLELYPLYERYFLKHLIKYAKPWLKNPKIRTIREFDNAITVPKWGFKDADDYYKKCSILSFLSEIKHPCDLIFAKDDPLIDYRAVLTATVAPTTKLWLTSHGGHVGFLGNPAQNAPFFWLDQLLLEWVGKIVIQLEQSGAEFSHQS